jgi:predicted transcriptional regulator
MAKPQLKANGYSPTEVRVFNALVKAESPMTSDQLLPKIYRAGDRPYHARIVVNSTVHRLAEKMDINREAYKIKRVKRKGARLIETALVRR